MGREIVYELYAKNIQPNYLLFRFKIEIGYKEEAEVFLKVLRARFKKFGLELAEENIKILEFGRIAVANRKTRG